MPLITFNCPVSSIAADLHGTILTAPELFHSVPVVKPEADVGRDVTLMIVFPPTARTVIDPTDPNDGFPDPNVAGQFVRLPKIALLLLSAAPIDTHSCCQKDGLLSGTFPVLLFCSEVKSTLFVWATT